MENVGGSTYNGVVWRWEMNVGGSGFMDNGHGGTILFAHTVNCTLIFTTMDSRYLVPRLDIIVFWLKCSINAKTHTRSYISIYTHTEREIYIYKIKIKNIYVYIYIYLFTHTHTHTHTHEVPTSKTGAYAELSNFLQLAN